MAESSTQGILVAPSTKIPSLLFPTPETQESGAGLRPLLRRGRVEASACPSPLTLHLDQELRLDAPRGLAFVLVSGAAQRVHLVDEDDGGFLLAGQVKQVLHQPYRNKQRWGTKPTLAKRTLEPDFHMNCHGRRTPTFHSLPATWT